MNPQLLFRQVCSVLCLTLCLNTVEAATKGKGKSKPKAAPTAPTEDKKESPKASDDKPTEGPKTEPRTAAVSSLATNELFGFYDYPAEVQRLIEDSLALTRRNLTYTFGSSNPKAGGMDCSGTVYYVLQTQGLATVPRQSDEMAAWVKDKGTLHLTPTATSFDDAAFADLEPGDLLFWSGTYDTGARSLPVSHVMIYLGKRKSDKKRVAFGASDGRYYKGERRCGVSVFDLTFPKAEGKATFFGYGAIPGLAKVKPREVVRKAESQAVEPTSKPTPLTDSVKPKVADTEKPAAASNVNAPTVSRSTPPKDAPAKKQTKREVTEPEVKPAAKTSQDSATASSKPKPKPKPKKRESSVPPAPVKPKATQKPAAPSQPAIKLPSGITRNAKKLVNGLRSLFD